MNIKHNKDEVLKTGLGLFCSKGYNSLGIDEICSVTGMTKGAFYNAFKSKELFLIEAILLYSKNNCIRIQKQLQPEKGITALARLETFYIDMLAQQPNVNFMGCFINNIMAELGANNEKVGVAAAKAFDEFIAAIVPSVEEAQQQNELKKDREANSIAELLHATFYGLLTRTKCTKNQLQSIETMRLLFNNLKSN